MFRALSRSRFALWLPLVLAIGCQPVREDRSINFQKDGDQVAFQHGNDGVFVADKDGGPAKKIFQPAADVVATSAPLWSPTDKRLIFTTAKRADDKAKQVRLDGDGDPAGKLHLEGQTIYTCWLREEEKDGKAPEPVALFHAACDHPGYVAANLAVRWHPDGKHVLFVDQTGDHEHAVFEFDLQTKKSRQVFEQSAEGIVFDWAPDNSHLVCVLGNNRQSAETDGVWIGTPGANDWWHVPETVALAQADLPGLLSNLRATRPIWTRDGKRFVFVNSVLQAPQNQLVHTIYLGTLATQTVESLAVETRRPHDIRWSPNGERVGYIAGDNEGPLVLIRVADKGTRIVSNSVRAFAGWDEKNESLVYITAEPLPQSDGAKWTFLMAPNQRGRDALWLAPADGSTAGDKVFSGMQITFPQWSPTEGKLSLWATFNPAYRSLASDLAEGVELMTLAVRIAETNEDGKTIALNFNGLRVRPGDPALLFDPTSKKLDWKAIDAHEQMQLGHYYLLKRNYAAAWEWYEKANKAAKPEDVSEALFFQYYCLTKLGRTGDANAKLTQFERDCWAIKKLPEPPKNDKPDDPNAVELRKTLRAFAEMKAPQRALLQDLYAAEVFLSLDAAADGETYFRDGLKNATTDAARLSKAVVLAQFLLLAGKQQAYLDLANESLLPLLQRDAALAAAPAKKDVDPFSDLNSQVWQFTMLPLCAPEFGKTLSKEQLQALLVRLQELRKDSAGDEQRAWLDVLALAAHKRLGQAEADKVAKRLGDNPAHFDAAMRIEEARKTAAQAEELRKLLQFYQ